MEGRGWLLRCALAICVLLALSLVSGCGPTEPQFDVNVSVDSAHRPVFECHAGSPSLDILFTVTITLPEGQEESFSGTAAGNSAFLVFEQLSPGEYSYVVHWIVAGLGENLDNSEEKIVQQGAVITGNFVVPPGVPDEPLP
jgi:hypothetical protein